MSDFSDARRIMARRLREDIDLRHSYVANIAMLIRDNQTTAHGPPRDLSEIPGCNSMADSILDLMFKDAENDPPVTIVRR